MFTKNDSSFSLHDGICLSLDRRTDNGSVMKYLPQEYGRVAVSGAADKFVIFIVRTITCFFGVKPIKIAEL